MKNKTLLITTLIAGLLAACSSAPVEPTAPSVTAVPSATPIPPTPTTLPRELTICLGEEPESLFLYNGTYSQSMLTVWEAIYDGPVDYVDYQYQPVILEQLPDLARGGAILVPVEVSEGMEMVDPDGNLMTLHKDIKYIPSGCSSPDCIAVYDGKTPVTMDQMVVTFKLKPGITWSDSMPLTAQDSVFSFELASSPMIISSKGVIHKTASYTALDELTVEWRGKPGFHDAQYASRFWLPLPAHLLASIDTGSLITDPRASETPLGWGAFILKEWTRGDHIKAMRNPAYFRAVEGLPGVDILTFRFTGTDTETNVNALVSGECDILDQSTQLDSQVLSLLELEKAGKLSLLTSPSPSVELLNLNIKPASYDDGYHAARGDRADIFGDVNVRQAMQLCIDRESLNVDLLGGLSIIPASYQPGGDPLADVNLPLAAYDPAAGAALLEQAGWRDHDHDPATPRIAFSAKNVYAGTVLEANLVTTTSGLRMAASETIAENLQTCGFKINLSFVPKEQLFAARPDGQIFGRSFDLAVFRWGGIVSGCQIFESAKIPTFKNSWIGENVTGYSSAAFDTACQTSRMSLPGQVDYETTMQKPQAIFSADAPVIPLYQLLRVAAAGVDVCGVSMDATSRSSLWNIESVNFGDACP
ncbi:MAG: hypothetical protein C0391_08655 [Anaerolinea sp.]|nr:hypothetical protein [Anaerolinea sp.]